MSYVAQLNASLMTAETRKEIEKSLRACDDETREILAKVFMDPMAVAVRAARARTGNEGLGTAVEQGKIHITETTKVGRKWTTRVVKGSLGPAAAIAYLNAM
jgi:hypothetical protein